MWALARAYSRKRTRAFISFGPFIALALFNGCKAFKDVVFSPHSQNFRHLDGVSLGCFPDKSLQQTAVLDLTAEFHHRTRVPGVWYAYPLMDLVVPDVQDIAQAVAKLTELRQGHLTVVVCCALGLSRSATVVAAWLLAQGHVSCVQEAIDLIKSQRPQVVLTPAYIHALEQFQGTLCQISL